MRQVLSIVPALLGLLVVAPACSSETDSDGNRPTGTSSGASSTACAADTRKDIFTQGMMKPAADLEVELVDSAFTPSGAPAQPGQVQKGMNTITALVLDANKQPVDGAAVNLALFMPDHGHGSAAKPVITPMGSGRYEITNVWLPMSGLWRFTIQVNQAGTLKTTDFNFCIDG